MAREIEIQRSLIHPHVMSILDSDSTNRWFTMPLADGDLRALLPSMTLRNQVQMIDEFAQGLDAAHHTGHIHRDVTPGNILRLSEGERSRFVVADWGLVRQPHGQTTAALTSESRFIGTQGFAAPEMYVDPHGARATADIYSLGRVAAWMATGTLPVMMEPLLPEGPWRSFVRRTTERDPSARVQTMAELRQLLAGVREEVSTSVLRAGPSDPEMRQSVYVASSSENSGELAATVSGRLSYLQLNGAFEPHLALVPRVDVSLVEAPYGSEVYNVSLVNVTEQSFEVRIEPRPQKGMYVPPGDFRLRYDARANTQP